MFSSITSDEPLVGIFVDGIYAGMNVAAIHDLFELEMVEIMRGPQGTPVRPQRDRRRPRRPHQAAHG